MIQIGFLKISELSKKYYRKSSKKNWPKNIEIKNHNTENQLFTLTNIPDNTKTSLEASPTENLNTIDHSRPMETKFNETTEIDFNSTLLDDGTLSFISYRKHSLVGWPWKPR